jgi:L-threonylcarbamoyladenylate synthase
MRIVSIDPTTPDQDVIARAADALRAGELVAFPTETVYGLGANALDAAAVDRIYEAKGRPAYNPLIVHVADATGARRVVREWPEAAGTLARHFWPGPLTLVLPKETCVPDNVTAGLPSVAVRVPAHPVAHALLTAADIPVAAPSANRSMMLSPTTAQHVAKSLGDRVSIILDAGPTTVGIESTVVDLTAERPRILRPGILSADDLEAVIGPVDIVTTAAEGESRPSPGMLDRHYAPRAKLALTDAAAVPAEVERARANNRVVGAIVIQATVPEAMHARLPDDARAYAARLYRSLHELDDAGCDVIVVERVPNGAAWAGVRDRLERAARSDRATH